MNRRAFLWMALGTLAGAGCVSRTQSGVAGRAENLGRLRVRWQIANSSNKDFAFDAAQWALDPQRKVQREALPPPSQGVVVKA